MDKQAIAFTPIGRVVMVSDTTSIREMILLCHNKGIQSCPVYTGAKEDNNYIGIVSVLHVVRRMMASFAQPSGIQEVDEDNLSDSDEVEIDFAALPSEFVSDPVGSLPLDSFEPIHEGAMLQDVMKRMVDHKLKRIPVLSSSGKLVNFVSESLLIRQLAAQPELLGELADMDLEDALEEAIGDEEQQVVSVSAEDSVSEAFEILSDKGFNAVPVLGEGQFLGEITIRQAYQISIASNKMRLLNMSCRQFVAYCNRRRVSVCQIANACLDRFSFQLAPLTSWFNFVVSSRACATHLAAHVARPHASSALPETARL
eukprot:TRINITY_DN11938_c5_g1_i1.p1 TRINITY_DN11938_c5_g1~~TRINITY_DN11938_c5_g1_i1.p1  ORF type:complete len:341 (+),score=48.86 TRINITY_DN11938_c5_g1_i1:83-1024(+)